MIPQRPNTRMPPGKLKPRHSLEWRGDNLMFGNAIVAFIRSRYNGWTIHQTPDGELPSQSANDRAAAVTIAEQMVRRSLGKLVD